MSILKMAKSFDKTSTTGLKKQLGLQLLRQNESKMNGCTFKIVCRKNRINKHGLAGESGEPDHLKPI